jgi:hypothetical protein
MEIEIVKHWNESYLIGGQHFKFPISVHHDTKFYKHKFQNKNELIEIAEQLKKHNVPVVWNITSRYDF